MALTTHPTDAERRNFYRINDDVYLEYLVLSDGEVETAIKEFNSQARQHFNPINQLQAITIRSSAILDKIHESSPDTAAYLRTVDERIQLLAHAIAQDQVGVPIVPNEKINLSAGGLSFFSEQPYNSGTLVEFSIIIAPSYLHISALGAVVYCRREEEHNAEYPYRVGVEFSHIHEADREALFIHIEEKKQLPQAEITQ